MYVQRAVFVAAIVASAFFSASVHADSQEARDKARGKYLIEIGGCNDCHTTGFAQSGGTTPETEWLKGSNLGFRGAWGTTYPTNLRESIGKVSESEWVARAKSLKTRPPMPWWVLNTMTENDLAALYKYVKSLGAAENTVPAYVPPEEDPSTPYIQWLLPPEAN